jgi:hypothetical protein
MFLNDDERQQARDEGWNYRSGRIWGLHSGPFQGRAFPAYNYVLERALAGSELHHRAVMASPWNEIDQYHALDRRGWGLDMRSNFIEAYAPNPGNPLRFYRPMSEGMFAELQKEAAENGDLLFEKACTINMRNKFIRHTKNN